MLFGVFGIGMLSIFALGGITLVTGMDVSILNFAIVIWFLSLMFIVAIMGIILMLDVIQGVE